MNYTPPEPLLTFREGDSDIIPAGTKVFAEVILRSEVERVRRETVEECAKCDRYGGMFVIWKKLPIAGMLLYTAPQPAAQEPTSAVPVVEQLLSALMYHRDQTRPINTTTEAIAAGQQYLKENGK